MTDRDDFRGGFPQPTMIALYGAPPMSTSPRASPMPRDLGGDLGGVIDALKGVSGSLLQPTTPAPPRPLTEAVAAMKARAAWLENELRMHVAWTEELALLKKMITVYDEPAPEQEGEAKR